MASSFSIGITIGASVGAAVAGIKSVGSSMKYLGEVTETLNRRQRLLKETLDNPLRMSKQRVGELRREYVQLGQTIDKINAKRADIVKLRHLRQYHYDKRAGFKDELLGAAAAGGVIAVPVKLAVDFESAMADVKKVVDFDTPQQFRQMERDILKLSRDIPMAGKELAAIVAAGGQSGVARKDLTGFASDAAKMGVAFDMAAGDAGEAMATLSNVLQIPIPKISRLGDAINHLSDNANSKAADIVNVLTRVGSDTKQLGLTENQAAALGSTFLSMGKTPELAAQAVKGMVTSLSVLKTGGGRKELARLGLTAKEFAAAMNKDANGAILNLLSRIKQLPKDEQFPLLLKMFGRNYADDVMLLANNVGEYNRQLDLLSEKDASGNLKYLGSMQREFANRSATTANQFKLFKNGLAEIGITVGSVLLPAINGALASVKPLVGAFADWAAENPKFVSGLVHLVAGLAALKIGGLGFRFLLNEWRGFTAAVKLGRALLGADWLVAVLRFKSGTGILARSLSLGKSVAAAAFSGIGRAFSGLLRFLSLARTAVLSLGRALLATPVGWIAAALAAAAFLIYKYWRPIKAFFLGFWDGLTAAFKPVLPLFDGLAAALGGIWETVRPVLQPVLDWLGEFFSLTQESEGGARGFGETVGSVIGGILAAVVETGAMIVDGWRMIFDTLFGAADAAWTEIKTAFDGGLSGILALIVNWSPLGAFYSAFAAVMGWFGIELPAKFTGFGQMLLDGLVNGIKSKVDAVIGTVTSLVNRIKSAFTGPVAIHSPSRVFKSYGGYLMEGLQLGIGAAAGRPLAAVQSVAGRLKQRFTAGSGLSAEMAASIRTNADEFAAARQNQAAGGGITVHFNPTINAPGGDPQQIQAALRLGLQEFETMYRRMMAEIQRRAY